MSTTPETSQSLPTSETSVLNRVSRSSAVLQVQNTTVEVAGLFRRGTKAAVVFLHGFGGSKEDYADFTLLHAFKDRTFIAYDAPGCGESTCASPEMISIPFLVDVAAKVIEYFEVKEYHLVGHSMGGLTALMLTQSHSQHILSFTNIKGNLAPEDCFLSRQILTHAEANPEVFLDRFIQRANESPMSGSRLFAAAIRAKVRPAAVRSIFESMVHLSDHIDLLNMFLGLRYPQMFMYGEQFAGLSYLQKLDEAGVELAEIPFAGHFPMYSNPVAMWQKLAKFLEHDRTVGITEPFSVSRHAGTPSFSVALWRMRKVESRAAKESDKQGVYHLDNVSIAILALVRMDQQNVRLARTYFFALRPQRIGLFMDFLEIS